MAITPTIDEVELDRDICREATGSQTGLVTVAISGNANEDRNIEWDESRREWQVMWAANARQPKFRSLVSFFEARRWRGYGFRFFDWSDHDDWGHGTIEFDEEVGLYRFYKIYPDAIRPTRRTIFKPIQGTINLFGVAGTPVINYANGTISGATSGGTWTGHFNIPARFNSDKMTYKLTPELNVVWEGMPIIELTSTSN